ncbi:MAG: hypothetical protein QW520_06690, partial [Methanomassiliicoccales archaeon]
MNLRQALNKAIQNETSGASQFIEEVANDLISVLEDRNFIKDVNEIRRFALELFRARSSMAPVFHLCNLLLLSIEDDILNVDLLKNKIVEFRKMEREQRIQAASICAAKLNGSKFITISRSGSVIDALKELKLKRGIEVVVMESQPGGEGLKTAKDLFRLGIKVILISDTMVFNEAQKCDAGLVGADSLIPNG